MGSSASPSDSAREGRTRGKSETGDARTVRDASSTRGESFRSSRPPASLAAKQPGGPDASPDAAVLPAVRAKTAFINIADYEDPKLITRFSPICESMQRKSEDDLGFNSADVTPRVLSNLTGQLRLFMENVLGKNAEKSHRPITKLPHRLFSDYKPDGALEVVLSTCLRFKASSGLRRLDFTSGDKLSLYLDMLRLIEKNLVRGNLLPSVKVFITQQVPAEKHPKLRSLVQGRGVIVSSASSATHIIYPDPEGTTPLETDGTDYCRTLEFAHAHALVHWWYYPDSYDSWIPMSDVQGEPDPDAEHHGPWHVQMRWLHDTDLFNEWMNEADYEVPEDTREIETRSVSNSKVQGSDIGAVAGSNRKSSKKRKRSEIAKGERSRENEQESDRPRGPEGRGNVVERKTSAVENLPNTDDGGLELSRVRNRSRDRHRERDRDKDRERGQRGRPDRDRYDDSDGDRTKRESSGGSAGPGASGEGGRRRRREPVDYDQVTPTYSDSREGRRRLSNNLSDSNDDHSRKHLKSSTDDAKSNPSSADSRALKVRISVKRDVGSDNAVSRDLVEDQGEKSYGHSHGLKVRVKLSTASKVESMETGESADCDADLKTKENFRLDFGDGGKPETAVVSAPDKVMNPLEGTDKAARRSKPRKERQERRGFAAKNAGVSVVEIADPIPEADIRKIRNISMESMENNSWTPATRPDESSKFDGNDDRMEYAHVTGTTSIANGAPNGNVEDFKPANCRRTVAAFSGLNGAVSGSPVSTADLIESLPQAPLRIPAQSRWFSMESIHDLEKRSLPEFFLGRSASKTPEVYKTYRDFMVDTWRQCPTKYLTATAIRRHLAGDVCAILRVHAFLEHWGLINFGVEPETRPQYASMKGIRSEMWKPAPVAVQSSHSNAAGRSGDSSIPRLLLFDEAPPTSKISSPKRLQNVLRSAAAKPRADMPLATRREIYAAAAAVLYECDACGADCSRMRYHCVGQVDVDLCPSCFAEGRYPTMLSARDFEQLTTVTSSHAYDGSVWSETEVLLLLEGLEKFNDDWNAVASHVRTKTNEQCVLQFLRMPIEDSFLGDQLGKWGRAGSHGAGSAAASGERFFASGPLPFADSSNPVMAQIAFLASSVSPEVAAAAAQAALTKIMSETKKTASPMRDVREKRTGLATALMNGEHTYFAANEPSTDSNCNDDKPNISDGRHSRGSSNVVSDQSHRLAHGIEGDVSMEHAPARMNGIPSVPSPHGSRQAANIGNAELDEAAVQASAAVGLAAAAARARSLADAELREIERAFAVVVETKLHVIEDKMHSFSRMEDLLRAERDRMERQRQIMYADRISAARARSGGKDEDLGVALDAQVGSVGLLAVQQGFGPAVPRSSISFPQEMSKSGPDVPLQINLSPASDRASEMAKGLRPER
jgi:SWI/SNF related-matrix-associated actin-dependent regulator of chromatin subfamily C